MLVLLALLIPADRPETIEPLAVFSDIRKVISYPPAVFGIITGFLFITGNELVNVVFGVWMQDSYAIKIATLGTASVVIGFSELAGEGISAILADRLGKERTVGVSLFLNAVWVITLPWLEGSLVGAFVWLFLFYLTFEVAMVSILPLITEITPATRATMISLFIAALSLGRALGDLVAPLLFRNGFLVNTLVCAALDLLGLLVLSRIKLPRETL